MCPSLIEIGSKTAEKNTAQSNKQTNRQTNRHYEYNGHLAMNQKQKTRCSEETVHHKVRGVSPEMYLRNWEPVWQMDIHASRRSMHAVSRAARSRTDLDDKWRACYKGRRVNYWRCPWTEAGTRLTRHTQPQPCYSRASQQSITVLWPPYVIGQAMYIFILRFLLSFFFSCLISAVGDWMSTILPHMVWP